MRWDEWRGSMDGRPVLWVRHLLCGRGFHVDIHKMVAPDDAECFHTHPAHAIRIILWGGYAEELEGSRWRMWRPGMIGWVRPSCCHRVAGFRNGRVSYSLWIRFRKVAKVIARGSGWAKQEQLYRAPDTVIEVQIVEVQIAPPHKRRVMAIAPTEADAEAFIKFAVMRRGVEHQFYVAEPLARVTAV